MKWISRYSGWMRQVRLFYWLNNLLHRKALLRNRDIYEKLGIRLSVLRSIDSRKIRRFVDIYDPALIDLLPHPHIPDNPSDLDWSQACAQWNDAGFIRLDRYFNKDVVVQINKGIDDGLAEGSLAFNYSGRKIFNAQNRVTALRKVTHDPGILNLLACLFNRQAVHFQTINFLCGSEQQAHSDSIHMTTVPLGFLAGVWVALEDIHEGSGPLTYYPGSHKLPYILNDSYGNKSSAFLLDGNANKRYEGKMREIIAEHDLKEERFLASAGDVFIWHANLLHGGAPILDKKCSRKSMVSHYFASGVLCFHEISERPAIIHGS